MLNTLMRLPLNVWVIAATLSLAMACIPLMVLIGGLLGAELSPIKTLATLPLALNVVGLALAAIPAAFFAKRYGRKNAGFLGLTLAFLGNVLCALATFMASFYCLLTGALFIGFSAAFFQQLRFAAIESLGDKRDTGPALSVIMLCSIFAGVLGPELGSIGRDIFANHTPYMGSFLLMAVIILFAAAVFSLFKNTVFIDDDDSGPSRPLRRIVLQPVYLVAVSAALVGYTVMAFLMTSTPLSMSTLHGHSLHDSKWVIQSHIVAMFAPSLFSGYLIKRFGTGVMMITGSVLYLVVIAVATHGHHLMHYWWALVLLGVGWNFLFMSGTSLLPEAYRHSERFKAQAINDFSVFAAQAIASLSAGWVLFALGWTTQLLVCLPIVIAMLVLAIYATLNKSPAP